MSVSIAICTFNGAKYLLEQLESIEAQTMKPDELIVCDDGSSDETLNILETFSSYSPFPVRIVVNDVNLGSTSNFSKAISLCSGDIIFLADQDDIWRRDKVDRVVQAFRANSESGYVFTDAILSSSDGDDEGATLWDAVGFDKSCRSRFINGAQVEALLQRSIVTGATMAFRKELVPIICPIPAEWVHDGWIALLSSASGYYGVPLPETLIRYRKHSMQQIGVKSQTINSKVKKFSDSFVSRLENEVAAYQGLRQRLKEQHLGTTVEMRLLNNKIKHLTNRIEILTRNRARRLPVVMLELLSGRYQKYSNSWYSVIADLSRGGK